MTTTLRNAMFQLHWFFGITAGVVLALVGATGAMLSFEHEILKALNPGVITVAARGRGAGAGRAGRAHPRAAARREAAIAGVVGRSERSGQGRLRAQGRCAEGSGRTGARRKPLRRPLHRRAAGQAARRRILPHHDATASLAGDGRCRQADRRRIDGDAGVLLPVGPLPALAATLGQPARVAGPGLAAEGPQLPLAPAFDRRHLGAGVLPGDGVDRAVVVVRLVSRRPEPLGRRAAAIAIARSRSARAKKAAWANAARRPAEAGARPSAARSMLPRPGPRSRHTAPAWSTATLQWPRDGGGMQFRYLDATRRTSAPATRSNSIRGTLAVHKHERYDAKPTAQKLVGSMFALHRGSFFGTAGVVLFMLASLLMPLFAITGWMLYLDRRRKQHAARALASAQAALPARIRRRADCWSPTPARPAAPNDWRGRPRPRCAKAACDVRVERLGRLRPADWPRRDARCSWSARSAKASRRTARAASRGACARQPPSLASLKYAVLALGDREYDSYCEFGRDTRPLAAPRRRATAVRPHRCRCRRRRRAAPLAAPPRPAGRSHRSARLERARLRRLAAGSARTAQHRQPRRRRLPSGADPGTIRRT